MGKRKRSKAPVLPPPPPAATAPSKKRSRGGRGNAKKARPAGGGDSQDSPTAEGQALIAKYHTLNKYLESLDHQPNLTPEEKRQKREELHRQLEELGGLEVYQQSSLRGESCQHYKAFNSSLWVLPEIRSRRLYQKSCGRSDAERDGEVEGSSGAQEPAAASGRKLRLLDVGAITNHYSKESNWLQVTAIDLHPQDPSVLQADFFEFAPILLRSRLPATATEQQEEAEKEATGAEEESPEGGCFDVIVLSLVLNFVGDPRRRGEMLCHCANLLKAGTGHLFVVLPLPCLSNSRYLNHGLFLRLMEEGLGFTFAGNKKSNKLAFYIFRKQDGNAATTSQLRSLSSTQQKHISSDDEEEEEEEEEESDEDIGKERAGVTCSVRSNRYAKRKKCRFSTTNNNFCILLRCRHSSTSLS
ncbi:25S rRNA (adenine2142-N1)-methyltransferase [Balamuthia mandrillaris]